MKPPQLAAAVAAIALTTTLQAKEADMLLSDDFSTYAAGSDASPVWAVEAGQARVTDEGLEVRNTGTDAFAMRGVVAGSEEWSDYRLSFRVKLKSPGEDWRDGVWVGVRYAYNVNAYVLGFYAGRIYLYKILQDESVTGSKPLAQVQDRRAGLRDGQWHQIEVVAKGDTIAAAIDGETLLEATDNDPHHLSPIRHGRIMLGARKWTQSKRDAVAVFTDVKVLSLGEAAETPKADAMRRSLVDMIRPWKRREAWPSYKEYVATMQYWAKKHPNRIDVDEAGRSLEGEPILVARVTDKAVSDDNKHVILVTALDSGWERTGTCAALHTIEWLLGESELARESMKHHIVAVMPIPNPYGYVHHTAANSKNVNPYHGGRARSDAWDVAKIDLRYPDEAPHLAAITTVVDRFQPEFQMDLHGVGLKYAGQLVQPSVGSAYSNISNRPWDWRLLEHLIRFAGKAGYGYNRLEVDAQQLFHGEGMDPIKERFWFGRPFFYTAHYGYAKYHTMPCTSEVAWEQGGVELVKGLLDFGNRQFTASPVPRFPVDRASYTVGNYSASAYGATVQARRASRVELWQRQEELSLGFLYNYTDGRDLVVCTIGGQAWSAIRGEDRTGSLDSFDFLRNLRAIPYIDATPIETFVLAGPQRRVYIDAPAKAPESYVPLKHGLAIEFPIHYPKLTLLDLRLNGRPLVEDGANGYQMWYSEWEGYTLLRVNIPPSALVEQNVFVISCAYKPGVQRAYGWQAPREVAEQVGE